MIPPWVQNKKDTSTILQKQEFIKPKKEGAYLRPPVNILVLF